MNQIVFDISKNYYTFKTFSEEFEIPLEEVKLLTYKGLRTSKLDRISIIKQDNIKEFLEKYRIYIENEKIILKSKKEFHLKVKSNFVNSSIEEIKDIHNGYIHKIIYLKLHILNLGEYINVICFDRDEFIKEISEMINEKYKNVKETIEFLEENKYVKITESE